MDKEIFLNLLKERILILDGGMGTMVQGFKLTEKDYRGKQFADWTSDLKGNNDLLCITRPDVIKSIHRQYLDAGADIFATNTFNANAISMEDYGMQGQVRNINLAAGKLAREVADGLGRHLGIGAGAQMLALIDELRPQVVRVHQRAVVGQRDERIVDGGDVRLGRLPGGLPAARGIAHVPDGHHALAKTRQRRLVEDLGHKPQVLRLDDRGAVAHGNAGALLAAMLQGLQPVAGQARHVLARGVHAEDAARLVQPIRLLAGKDAVSH